MNRTERLRTVIAGEQPDRIPVSVWFHFGSEHLPPETVAQLHAAYYRAYGWDFLKVMFDYRLTMAEAADGHSQPDLEILFAETDWQAPFARQRDCLRLLARELGDEVPILETIYSPWMYLVRHVGRDQTQILLDNPALTGAILDRLVAETCRHIDAVKQLGIFGVYFATVAGQSHPDSPAFALQAPGDRAVLERASGLARFLHLHGRHTRLDGVSDYPREVIHCEDRDPTNPTLKDLRNQGNVAIMGGLDHADISGMSQALIQSQIADSLESAGRAGFLLAPGCSVSPSLSRRTMQGLRSSRLLGCAAGPS